MLRKSDGTPVQAVSHAFGSPLVIVQHADGTQEVVSIATLKHDGGDRARDAAVRQVRAGHLLLIRRGTVEDLPALHALASSFCGATRFLEGFEMERFVAAWTGLLAGAGVVFLLEDERGGILGTLGGVLYPDLYSARLIATEFFWFVDPLQRGGGLKLYRAFEEWARASHADQLRMVHLIDSMPDQLERTYTHLGFTPAEIHYTKELT